MSKYTLATGLYLYLTPVGAYYAVTAKEGDKSRKFLKRLLQETETPALKVETLMRLMDVDEESKALELLRHCQNLGWIQGVDEVIPSPTGALEDILPKLLLSSLFGFVTKKMRIIDKIITKQPAKIALCLLFILDAFYIIAALIKVSSRVYFQNFCFS